MNVRRYKLVVTVAAVLCGVALADAVRDAVSAGNALFAEGKFGEAVAKYDDALVENPKSSEAKFNKAASYYRLDDLAKAMDLYREVGAESKDMKLVTKAKYNLGNCHFQQGLKQRDSDLKKAIEELETGITNWRSVLDIDKENEKAAKNIEVARLMIKDILDQLNKQQQEQDPNQPNQQQQDEQEQSQQQQGQEQQGQDPNQPNDPNESQDQGQDPNEPKDPNEGQSQQQPQEQDQQEQQQQAVVPDTTAQEILDKEQRQKERRQVMQRGRLQKVDKDW